MAILPILYVCENPKQNSYQSPRVLGLIPVRGNIFAEFILL